MADSPFCIKCYASGRLSHTYRIVRSRTFKCATCKTISEDGAYESIDFQWRRKFDEWKPRAEAKLKSAGFDPVKHKAEFDRIMGVKK